MDNNNFPQNNNNNGFYNNGNNGAPPQWGNQPYYDDGRMRVQENSGKSPIIPILVGVIIILLIAVCLIGGYLLGKNKNNDKPNEQPLAADLQTTIAETAPPATEPPTENAVQTEPATETVTETSTTEIQTSIVVSVQVVTEAPKTIFVGDYICDMRVATKSTDLNMRSSASTSASIIGSIPKDTIVSYYGSEGSWGIVYYNGKYGYVNTAYLSADLYPHYGDYGGPVATSYAVVNAGGGLNMRSSESTSASIITTISNGTEIAVLSSYDGWSYVNYKNDYGYVKSEYLKFK